MANSQQAGLPPINGLYVALFSSLVYAFLGTSREMSAGTNGIICLMIQSALRKYEGLLYPAYHPSPSSHNASNSSSPQTASGYLSADADEAKVMLAGTLCLLVAVVHLAMGLLNGGFIVRFISDVVINALTCSSAIVIIVGQVNSLMDFRISVESRTPFKLAENLVGIFTSLQAANVGALVLSVLMISVMYFTNRFVNVRFKKRFKVPLPIELIVIVVVDLVSYLAAFNTRFGIKILGAIPTQ
jgi:MFS superfamily sulfate permease-like transporter